MSELQPQWNAATLLKKYSGNNNALCEDAAAVREAITTLSRSPSESSEDSDATADIVRKLRALLGGMRKLPDEPMREILSWALVEETYRVPGLTDKFDKKIAPGLTLERVCRQWRAILISQLSPHIQVHDLDQFAVRDACRLLLRAGTSPGRKDLRFTINGHVRFWSPTLVCNPWEVDRRLSKSFDTLIPTYAPRIAELTLRCSLSNLLEFCSLLPGAMSALLVLRLFCLGGRRRLGLEPVRPLAVLAPKLEEFQFERQGRHQGCCCGDSEFALQLKPYTVRRLTLLVPENPGAVTGLIKVLRKSKRLAQCIAKTYHLPSSISPIFEVPAVFPSDDEVAVLSVTQLFFEVAPGAVAFFLCHISCPSLLDLRWTGHAYEHRAAMAFFNRSGSNLTTLTLVEVHLNSRDLSELFAGLKKLEKLVLEDITVNRDLLDGLNAADILPRLKVFNWILFDDWMISTITKFITPRCPGSAGRDDSSTLEFVTLRMGPGYRHRVQIKPRPRAPMLEEFRRTLDRWRHSGVEVNFCGNLEEDPDVADEYQWLKEAAGPEIYDPEGYCNFQ
ncbi:hypothetical protein C8R46DRAFT_1345356 [Mycena filopes]|nr:hypothetical protein C8R46DRAFT_1345356 [Mycena filopes]